MQNPLIRRRVHPAPLMAGFALLCSGLHVGVAEARAPSDGDDATQAGHHRPVRKSRARAHAVPPGGHQAAEAAPARAD
ncbi:hypothetical protein, partial [Gluconacetobacter sacchari]